MNAGDGKIWGDGAFTLACSLACSLARSRAGGSSRAHGGIGDQPTDVPSGSGVD